MRRPGPGTITLVPAPGKRYYQQKNAGAELAPGEILIFLDSDVVPDEGWLDGLLGALDDPNVDFVGGEAYHATDTLHDRLFAAFWAFPPKHPSRGVYRCQHFYANNLAVRREVFLANPFPDARRLSRPMRRSSAKSLRAKASPSIARAPRPSRIRRRGARARSVVRALCQGLRHRILEEPPPVRRLAARQSGRDRSCVGSGRCGQVLVKVATRARTRRPRAARRPGRNRHGLRLLLCKLAGEVVSLLRAGPDPQQPVRLASQRLKRTEMIGAHLPVKTAGQLPWH